jgi:hypothetical protein
MLKPFSPGWLDDLGLSPVEFRVYYHVVRRGKCYESMDSMADFMGISRSTVYRTFKFLEGSKLVFAVRKQGETTVYTANLTGEGVALLGRSPVSPEVQVDNGTCVTTGTGGVSPEVHPPVSPEVHKGVSLEVNPSKVEREYSGYSLSKPAEKLHTPQTPKTLETSKPDSQANQPTVTKPVSSFSTLDESQSGFTSLRPATDFSTTLDIQRGKQFFRQTLEAKDTVYEALDVESRLKLNEIKAIAGRGDRAWNGWIREQVKPHQERLGDSFQAAMKESIKAFHGSNNPAKWGLQDFVKTLGGITPMAAQKSQGMSAMDYLAQAELEMAEIRRQEANSVN